MIRTHSKAHELDKDRYDQGYFFPNYPSMFNAAVPMRKPRDAVSTDSDELSESTTGNTKNRDTAKPKDIVSSTKVKTNLGQQLSIRDGPSHAHRLVEKASRVTEPSKDSGKSNGKQ